MLMMTAKKVPLRRCVISKETLPKTELIRIVKQPDNVVVIDASGKLNGRGAYIKKDLKLLLKLKKSKQLERNLAVDIPETIYEQLEQLMKDGA